MNNNNTNNTIETSLGRTILSIARNTKKSQDSLEKKIKIIDKKIESLESERNKLCDTINELIAPIDLLVSNYGYTVQEVFDYLEEKKITKEVNIVDEDIEPSLSEEDIFDSNQI